MLTVKLAVQYGRNSYQYSTIQIQEENLSKVYESLYYCESRFSINKNIREGVFKLYSDVKLDNKFESTDSFDDLCKNCIVIYYNRDEDYYHYSPYIVYNNGIKSDFIIKTYFEDKRNNDIDELNMIRELSTKMLEDVKQKEQNKCIIGTMTLDEAIQHCNDNYTRLINDNCNHCANEHLQLANWLKELKKYKENDLTK